MMAMKINDEPLVKDILNKNVTVIESNASIKEAAISMKSNHIRQLIVVSGQDAVGILVDRDITMKVVAEGKNPEKVCVKEIMSSKLITAVENDSVPDIARVMVKNKVSRIPVVRGEQLVGLITYNDLLRTWPGYVDLLKEELNLGGEESKEAENQFSEGICDSCENYSQELSEQNGHWLCSDCLASE